MTALAALQNLLPEYNIIEAHGLFVIKIEQTNLPSLLNDLKNKLDIDSLMDLTCVHYPGNENCFCLVYNFLSLRKNVRIIVHMHINKNDCPASLHEHFAGSVWYEREIYDMYGVKFKNCPDQRRMLLDDSFEGHPLRKDFPLVGFVEPKYDLIKQQIIEEKVDLTQDYRTFDNLMPWVGTEYLKEKNDK